MEDLNAYLELINEREEYELEKDCALRGIKYKKKQKLQPMEFSQALEDKVKGLLNGKR